MAVQDIVVDWYIKNIIAPSFADYSNPGFIITKQDNKYGHVFQRDVCLPEELIEKFETRVVETYGEEGKKFLYKVGKNFGWNFGKALCIPTVNNTKEKEFLNMADFIAKFVGSTWAEKCTVKKIDLKKSYFEIVFENYIVCSKNGYGYLLNSGGLAGLWGYAVNNFDIEAVQQECQGRKSKTCRTICAPPEFFKDNPKDFFQCKEKIELDSSTHEYLALNEVKPTRFSGTSLKGLITNRVIDYSKGKFLFNKKRFLPLAIDLIFILETSLKELKDGEELLFSASFEEGKEISSNEKNLSAQYISDFLSACGWGDVLITNTLKGLAVNYYPWHSLSEKSNKEIFLGLLSGMLSVLTKKTVTVSIKSESVSSGFVSLNLEAEIK